MVIIILTTDDLVWDEIMTRVGDSVADESRVARADRLGESIPCVNGTHAVIFSLNQEERTLDVLDGNRGDVGDLLLFRLLGPEGVSRVGETDHTHDRDGVVHGRRVASHFGTRGSTRVDDAIDRMSRDLRQGLSQCCNEQRGYLTMVIHALSRPRDFGRGEPTVVEQAQKFGPLQPSRLAGAVIEHNQAIREEVGAMRNMDFSVFDRRVGHLWSAKLKVNDLHAS